MAQFIYGRWPVLECLRAGRRPIQKLLLAENLNDKGIVNDIMQLAEAKGIEIHRVPRRMIDDVSHDANHQGVVLRVGEYPFVTLDELLQISERRGEKPFYLALDLLKDPQNVGVLLRVADAVGAHGVLLQERRGVGITPAVVAASSGAVEHLAVAQVSNLVNALRLLKEQNVWIVGLDIGPNIQPIDRVDLDRPLAIVLGSEGEGMRRLVRDTCDFLITLPMRGAVESLNVATVGSIAMYKAWEARGWAGWGHAERSPQ